MTETDALGAELDELGDRGCVGGAPAGTGGGRVGGDGKDDRCAAVMVAGRETETGAGSSVVMAVGGVDLKAGGVSGGAGAVGGGGAVVAVGSADVEGVGTGGDGWCRWA